MARVIVAYDLDKGWTEAKKRLMAGNFYDGIVANGKVYGAPNTTVYINNVDTDEAVRQFDVAIALAGKDIGSTITVQRMYAVTVATDGRLRDTSAK